MAPKFRTRFTIFLLFIGFYEYSLAFDNADQYFETWKTTEFRRLAPFGQLYYDQVQSGVQYFDLNIDFSIPFYGRTYSRAFVTSTGAIILGDLQIAPIGTKFPNELYDGSDEHPDPTMLAVYYAQTNLDTGSKVNYRIVDPNKETPETIEYDVSVLMLEHIRNDVRWAIMGAEHFDPSVAIIVTWQDMTFPCVNPSNCPRNTFQVVLATDGNETYTIYNFHKLTWENSLQVGCDLHLGTTTPDYPDCFSAQVGFNAGQGREFFPLPYSNTESVIYLDEMASHKGRYVYEVSGEVIRRGECLHLDASSHGVDPSSWPLTAWPPSLSTLGGQELHVSGPCLLDTDEVVCRFYDEINVRGHKLDDLRAACVVPMMLESGDVTVDLLVNDQPTPFAPARIHLEHPGRARLPVHLQDMRRWLEIDASELSIVWDPRLLTPTPYSDNVTQNEDDIMVDIVLYGYRETNTDKPEWSVLKTIGKEQVNDGHFTFDTSQHQCEGEVCSWAQAGAMKVVLSGENPDNFHGLFSKSFPLQWFISDAMREEYGDDWPYEKCRELSDNLVDDPEWTERLPPCPCFFNQALNDKKWMQDPDCEDFVTIPENPNPCIFQPVASRCFVPTGSGDEGHSSKCCYDKEDHLLYSGDNSAGSFTSLVHPDGVEPYRQPGKVPHWSHWIKDKMPYLLCCKWAANKDLCYDHFLRKRPTPDCKHFQPPGQAAAFGDPHFRTFDGTTYTFNPHGEFWLVKIGNQQHVPDFKLQARMEVPNWPEMTSRPLYVPAMNATVLTAVVMVEGDAAQAPKVEMRLNAPISKTKVSVLVNEKLVSFDDGVRRREFWGREGEANQRVVVMGEGLPDPWSRQFANFSVIFQSGIVVRVAGNSGLFQVNVVLPRHYFTIPRGLFGAWTGEKNKDLINRDGEIVEHISNEHIHKNFGMTWMTSDTETLFKYIANVKWANFSKPDFRPYFELSEISPAPEEPELENTCGDNFMCRFDYMTLFHAGIAKESLDIDTFMNDVDRLSAYVPACEHIIVPFIKSTEQTSGYFLPDGEITFAQCQEGYSLRGTTKYKCLQQDEVEASWQPEPDIFCKSNKEIANENSRLAAAIAVPICVVVVIAAAVGGVFFMRKRKTKQNSRSTGRPSQNDNRNSDIDMSNDKPHDFTTSRLSFLPNPMGSIDKHDDLHRSNGSVGSRTSRGSIVLTQELTAARPPRPNCNPPKLTKQSRLSFANPVQMEDGSTVEVPPAETDQEMPPKGVYANPIMYTSAEDLQNRDSISRDSYTYQAYGTPLQLSRENLHYPMSYEYDKKPQEPHPYSLVDHEIVRASQENLAKPAYEFSGAQIPMGPQISYQTSNSDA